jgi:quercetin dioxygenase-like cupin family protein
MASFRQLEDLPLHQAFPGIGFRYVHGERATFSVFELDPNAELPTHSHHNEQIGMLIRGSVTFRTDQGETEVGPGQIWVIPGGEEHGGVAGPQGATVVEVFSPPRTDWPQA